MKQIDIINFENFVKAIMKTYNGQGISIVGFDQYEILYEFTSGYRDVAKKLPIDKDTVFGIASISKSFTIIAVLQLAERGIINLDARIDTYLKGIDLPESQMPTVRQLMSHAGGFLPQERFLMKDVAEKLAIPEDIEKSTSKVLSQKGLAMIIDRINQMKRFTGLPGERHSYSNFSFGLLTALVEIYGDYDLFKDHMMANVIQPMGLEHTFYDFKRTLKEGNITRLYENVLGHLNVTDDYEDMGFVLLGGGAVKSTMNDMIQYARFYLNEGMINGKQILSKANIEAMSVPRLFFKPTEGYGYGLLAGRIGNIPYMGHGGSLTGVSSYFAVSKSTGKGIVVLCNTSNIPTTAIGIAALKLINDQIPDYFQGSHETVAFTEEVLASYKGTYKSEEGANFSLVVKEGKLFWQTGDDQYETKLLSDGALLVKQKMIENYSQVLKDDSNKVWAIYSGSRIILKVDSE